MRLILGSGLQRVVYIDPYPKSLVPELYGAHLGVTSSESDPRVQMEPFLGVAPRLVSRVFGQVKMRKRAQDGAFDPWVGKDAPYVGAPDRFIDAGVLREAVIAGMLQDTYLPLLDAV
jgi:cytidine deaminase